MNRLKEFSLGKVELLCVRGCLLGNTFHEILDQCVKLKRLEVIWSVVEGSYKWLDCKYPTLEYLKLQMSSIEGIPMFLTLNSNIRKFAANGMWLWKNRDKVMRSNVKLDNLAIEIHYLDMNRLQSMCVFLNQLHEVFIKNYSCTSYA